MTDLHWRDGNKHDNKVMIFFTETWDRKAYCSTLSRGEAVAAATEKDLPSQLDSLLFSVFKQKQNHLVDII